MKVIYTENQQHIAEQIEKGINISKWTDWKWHLKHLITELNTLEKLLGVNFSKEERENLEKTIKKFPMAITPYYLSLIDTSDIENDPIFKQAVPSIQELDLTNCDMSDPLHEDEDSPVPGITHRYPDRVLLLVSNMCAVYCRHCTRKRKVGDKNSIPNKSEISKAIEYIRQKV
jgi:lysine 2,3-aminomutase